MSEDKSVVTPSAQASDESTKDRRDFLRNSVLAAGAVATFAVAESASAQTCYDAAGNIVKSANVNIPQVIDIAFDNSNLVLEDLYGVIKQLGKLTGCLNCGFNGFDLRFRINPVIRLDARIPVAATLRQG
jgi:aminoglycoside/choline kinase family phosphotransferase